jgi:hypothetical protein
MLNKLDGCLCWLWCLDGKQCRLTWLAAFAGSSGELASYFCFAGWLFWTAAYAGWLVMIDTLAILVE